MITGRRSCSPPVKRGAVHHLAEVKRCRRKRDELGFGGRLATIHLYPDHYPPVAFLEKKKIGADYRLKMLSEKGESRK